MTSADRAEQAGHMPIKADRADQADDAEKSGHADNAVNADRPRRRLADIAIARSGDKGNRATLCVIALDAADYPLLERWLTAERVREVYRGVVEGPVVRHVLPQLAAVHFVMDAALAGGVTRSLALDAHGKTLSSAVLALPMPRDEAGRP